MADIRDVFDSAGIDGESLTVVLVAGGTSAEVIAALGAEAEPTEFDDVFGDDDYSAYAVAEVTGGVIAFEQTGYADPSPRVLAALSALGGAAAVTRSNIQGQERFGCARAGELEFDANEFMYVEEEEKSAVPSEIRPLFDAAWVDLDSDDEDDLDEDGPEVWVGMEMAILYTGVRVNVEDLARARAGGLHRVRTLTYLD